MTSRIGLGYRSLPLVVAACAVLVGVLAAIDPMMSIVLVLGLAFVALALTDVMLGLCLFCLAAFLETLPRLGEVSAAKAVGLLLVVSWLATLTNRSETRKDFFADHPAIASVALLFLAWTAISALWAQDSGEAISAVTRYGPNMLLLPIAYTAIRGRRDVLALVTTFLACALLSALYGMAAGGGDSGDGRLSGAGVDANELALTLVGAVALGAALAAARSLSGPARWACASGALLGVVAVLMTASRTGLVGLGAVAILGVVFAGRGRRMPILVVGIIAALSLSFYVLALAPEAARDRLIATEQDPGSEGGSGRTDIWSVGWRMVEDKPVQGVGAGNFALTSVSYLLQPGDIRRDQYILDEPKAAHNIYLEVLAELGVIGLALFLAIIGFAFACTLRAARLFAARGDPTLEIVSRAVLVALGASFVASSFISIQFHKPLWLLLALAPVLLALAKQLPDRRVEPALANRQHG